MSEGVDLKQVKAKLDQAGPILVLFGQRSGIDEVASALALYLSLKEQGRDVTIASPVELRAEFSRLVGLDEISNSVSNRDLVIGFPGFDFANIEKVTHNEGADEVFELVIQPKKGIKPPDKKQVSLSYRGGRADLIFTVGVNRLTDLGQIHQSESKLFTDATVVALGRAGNPDYSEFSIFDNAASSVAEVVNSFMQEMEWSIKEDVASNLLAGLDHATNRFSHPQISAQAFLTAGKLIQSGAKRQPPRIQQDNQPGQGSGGFMPFVPPSSVNRPPRPMPAQGNQPPQEWLQPKIYKGGSQV